MKYVARWQSRAVQLLAFLAVGPFLVMPGLFGEMAFAQGAAPHLRKIRKEQFPGSILALDLAATSNLAVVALSGGRVRVWRIDTGETVHEFTFPEPDSALRDRDQVEPIRVGFSPDGKTLGASHLSRIYLYDTADWREVGRFGVEGEDSVRPRPVPTPAPRPAYEEHRTAQEMGQAYTEMLAAGDGATRITDFAFTPDGSAILAAYCRGACYDRRLFVWPSGKDPVRLWDARSGQLLWEHVYSHEAVIEQVVPSPDGKLFAAASFQPGWRTVQVYDLKSGERLSSLPPGRKDPDEVPSILFTPDSKRLITIRTDPLTRKFRPWEHLAMYDVHDGTKLADFPGQIRSSNADISPDGRWLVAPPLNLMTFWIYDVETQKIVYYEKHLPWGWRDPVDRVRFDPSGRYLVVALWGLGKLAVYQIGP